MNDAVSAGAVLLARQPILDDVGRIGGYELLFRSAIGAPPDGGDLEQATAHVLVAASDLDLARLTGPRRAWVNVTRAFLLTLDPLPLNPQHFVLELLEDQLVDPEFLVRLRRLRDEGHVLALDDYDPTAHGAGEHIGELLALATYVKLDVQALGDGFPAACASLVARGLTVVAEKVETQAERDVCAAAGAALFQGYFFERPRLLEGRAVPTGPVSRLKMAIDIQKMHDRDVIGATIATDPGLSVRLLRFANSAAVGARRTVGSVQDALILLGARPVRQWALMVLLSELGAGRPALIATALVRARLCEEIGREHGVAEADAYFAAGLLSVVDALLDQPLDQVVATLPLADELRDALLLRTGEMGQALELALRLQHGGAQVRADAERFADAVVWSETVLQELG